MALKLFQEQNSKFKKALSESSKILTEQFKISYAIPLLVILPIASDFGENKSAMSLDAKTEPNNARDVNHLYGFDVRQKCTSFKTDVVVLKKVSLLNA